MSQTLDVVCPTCNATGGHETHCRLLSYVGRHFAEPSNGKIAIDDFADLSIEKNGIWVQVWAWVPHGEWDEAQTPELHGLLCMTCGEDLNDQCLDPDCTQDDDHTAEDNMCTECAEEEDQ